MASLIYTQHYADGTKKVLRRSTKQGRKPSPDPRVPVTVRIPKSWTGDDIRHEIMVALHEYRTRNLVKS